MLKKILLSVCSAAVAFVSTSLIAAQYQFAPKMDMTYSLPPHTPTEFHNPMFFTIKATCVMEINSEQGSGLDVDPLYVVILKKSADINGETMNAGQVGKTLTIHNGEAMTINAKAGATAQLTNLGEHTITAHCTTTN